MAAALVTGIVTMMFNWTMLKYVGENGVAAITIIMYVLMFATSLYTGYSYGVAPMISFYYGEQNPDKLKKLMEERTVVKVKISEVVNAGAVAYLEGIRGFIPASRLSDEYVEDLKEWDGKTIEVTVITADEEERRLVLSGREPAREKKQAETKEA